MLRCALMLMLALQGVRAKISSGESTLSCELRGEEIFSGIAWTSINPEDRKKLSPPTGFFTGTDGKQKYQEAIIDCENPKNIRQPWCTARGSDWKRTNLKSIPLLTSIILPPVLDYRWEGIKGETTSNNDSMKRFSVNKNSLTTEISVIGSGPIVVDTKITLNDSKPILYWRLILDEIQNGKTQSTIHVCDSVGDTCTSVATRQEIILDPLRWIHLKFGCFDAPPILFVDSSTNKMFPKSTWLSTKYNEIKFADFSNFSYYSSEQEIYFQNSNFFRKIKQSDNTLVYLARERNRHLLIPDVRSGCWQILYYGVFGLNITNSQLPYSQKLEQNSTDDLSLIQIQLNSASDLYFTTEEWKNREDNNLQALWILGDIRECFGDVRVSKLVVPAGVRIEDIRCTAIKTGTTFAFSNSSPSIAYTTRVVVSSNTRFYFYVSMTTITMLIVSLIALGLMLWYHPIWCCVTSDRNDDLALLELRNPNPNVSSSTRYITSNCQSSASVEEVVYDEIDISKNPGPSGKSQGNNSIPNNDISNRLGNNIVPKSQTLESNDDVVYAEIKITANPGPSSESSTVYYSNQKTKEVYDRPSSAMYNNVDSQDDVIYEN